MSNTFIYASCKDVNGKIEYLVAPSEEDIEVYCEGGVLGHEKAIQAWYSNPTPIMVAHHFVWVGKERRPAILNISRPHNYDDPTAKPIEKW
tara:strand:- start:3666 stop:3938 length:273 start_codon:yes stop_codon:yes gene_type:complete